MPIIKRKSVLVIVVSSVVISLVLVFTLIGYYMYLEIKEKREAKTYSDTIETLKARL